MLPLSALLNIRLPASSPSTRNLPSGLIFRTAAEGLLSIKVLASLKSCAGDEMEEDTTGAAVAADILFSVGTSLDGIEDTDCAAGISIGVSGGTTGGVIDVSVLTIGLVPISGEGVEDPMTGFVPTAGAGVADATAGFT